jgi:hypothetical protein
MTHLSHSSSGSRRTLLATFGEVVCLQMLISIVADGSCDAAAGQALLNDVFT